MRPKQAKQLFLDVLYGGKTLAQVTADMHRDQADAFRRQCIFTKNCRYCAAPVGRKDAVITNTYWKSLYAVSHATCQQEGYRGEALECQLIDADCNDCKHFQRQKTLGQGVAIGQCYKLNERVRANVNYASGHACFIHRRVCG